MYIFGVSFYYDIAIVGLLFTLGLIINLYSKKIAEIVGLMDFPSKSILKIQKKPIPLSGGIAIFVTFFLVLISSLILNDHLDHFLTYEVILVLSLVMIAGVLDDKFRINARIRLLIYLIFSFVVALLFKESIGFNLAVLTAMVLVFAPGIVTAVNMIDGMDGICAGLSIVSFLGFLSMGLTQNNPNWGLIVFSLAGILSLFSFLVFNFNPAKIFLGSSGSELVGFIFVILIFFSLDGFPFYLLPLRILMIGVPILDMIRVMAIRAYNKKPLTAGDRNHIYDLLFRKFKSQRKVWVLMTAFQVVVVIAALILNAVIK